MDDFHFIKDGLKSYKDFKLFYKTPVLRGIYNMYIFNNPNAFSFKDRIKGFNLQSIKYLSWIVKYMFYTCMLGPEKFRKKEFQTKYILSPNKK
jgi:hypothetical protein